MDKIKLITDSTCDLSSELLHLHDIEVIPLFVSIGDNTYKDGVDLSTDKMYQLIEETKVMPKTSAISPGIFEEVFRKYLTKGYKILYLGIGSKFSGTFQSASIAKQLINSNDIYLIDSFNLSSGSGLLLLKASKFKKEGLPIDVIAKKITEMVPKVRSQFVIDTLYYLYKGGRLNALSAFMGKTLRIHPVIKVRNGVMEVGKKAIGSMRKGINIMLNEAYNIKDDIDQEFMMITHSQSKFLPYVTDEVTTKFEIKNTYITDAGCVISSHCGQGTIGILFLLK